MTVVSVNTAVDIEALVLVEQTGADLEVEAENFDFLGEVVEFVIYENEVAP